MVGQKRDQVRFYTLKGVSDELDQIESLTFTANLR